MQPILAESTHRRRAMVFAVVLTVAATLAAAITLAPRSRGHGRHYRHGGKCPYVYVVR
jgi:hypothetical protein